MTQLEQRGDMPSTASAPETGSKFNIELTQSRIKREELVHLSRQLAAFLRAGVPILSALAIIEGDGDSKAVRRVVGQISDDLRNGATLTEAFDEHPRDFPVYYRRILASAELTGRLDQVLDNLADYVEQELEARRKVTSALTYPVVVMAMAVITVIILSVAVLPQFEKFFQSLNVELPLTTRILLAFTQFISKWGIPIAVLLIVAGVGSTIAIRRGIGKSFFDRLRLKLPVVGPLYHLVLTERFCRLMASLAKAGVPLTTAMRVTAEAMNNVVFSDALLEAQQGMIEGDGLSGPLSETGVFPSTVVQMIRVGEATGTLEDQMEVAATFYERELDHKLKKATTLIEPAVVLMVGLVVGFVAVALVSAMYGIFQQGSVK